MHEAFRGKNAPGTRRLKIWATRAAAALAVALTVAPVSCHRAPPEWLAARSTLNASADGPKAGILRDHSDAPPAKAGPAGKAVASAGKQENPGSAEEDAVKKPPSKTASNESPLAGCVLCHVKVEDKFIRSVHYQKKVGCKQCHGPSSGHIADEKNNVKPDVVFTRANTDPLCDKCHECSRPVVTGAALPPGALPRICTDCHGTHSIAATKKEPKSEE